MENPELAKITVPYDQFHIFSVVSWIESNAYDPFVSIRTDYPGVVLPPAEMAKPLSTLNLAERSMHHARWTDTALEGMMRFNGQPFKVVIPYRAMVLLNFRGTSNFVATMWAMPDGKGGLTVPLPAPTAESPKVGLGAVAQTVTETKAPAASEPVVSAPAAEETSGRRVGHLRVIK